MRYRRQGELFDVVDLGGGVTYEIPVPQPKTYDKVIEIIDLGGGVTYEITSLVPRSQSGSGSQRSPYVM
jgi:hypothetical protein